MDGDHFMCIATAELAAQPTLRGYFRGENHCNSIVRQTAEITCKSGQRDLHFESTAWRKLNQKAVDELATKHGLPRSARNYEKAGRSLDGIDRSSAPTVPSHIFARETDEHMPECHSKILWSWRRTCSETGRESARSATSDRRTLNREDAKVHRAQFSQRGSYLSLGTSTKSGRIREVDPKIWYFSKRISFRSVSKGA